MPAGKLALIDGDIVRYQAASVSDSVSYHHPEQPQVTCRYKKDMIQYCQQEDLDLTIDLIKTTTPEPVEYCLHTIKIMLESIMEGAGCTSTRVFLTGKGNYREVMAVTYPYKGNRDNTAKPTHFDAAGDYLKDRFNAETIDGCEADDALGYESMLDPDNTVLCTTDKDLLMIPGWHYSWSSTAEMMKYSSPSLLEQLRYPYNKPFEITPYDADKWFYLQLLMGDPTDNIKGIKGIGIKKAEKILSDDGFVPYPEVIREWYSTVAGAYEQAGLSHDFLIENAHLLWMQREKGKLWEPPL